MAPLAPRSPPDRILSLQLFRGRDGSGAASSLRDMESPLRNSATTITKAWRPKERSSWCCVTSRRKTTTRVFFAGRQLTTHSEIVNKAINARIHGAVGMILVNDLGNSSRRADEWSSLLPHRAPRNCRWRPSSEGAVADEWLNPRGRAWKRFVRLLIRIYRNHSLRCASAQVTC